SLSCLPLRAPTSPLFPYTTLFRSSFRGWLRTVTHNAYADFLADGRRPDFGSGDSGVLQVLKSVEARSDLVARLEEQFDHEVMERSEEHTSELQSRGHLVCRLLLEK